MTPFTKHPKWLNTTKQFRWQLLVLLPWCVPLVSYVMLGENYFNDPKTFLSATILNAVFFVACQLLLDRFSQQITAHYPGLSQSGWRLTWLMTTALLITPVFVMGCIFLYDQFQLFGFMVQPDTALRLFLVNLAAIVVSVGAFESLYSVNKWQENMLEKEEAKKAQLQSQYESLKNQVSPHFLFNTFNSLSSLIEDEPERAGHFVDELANVYRYLLQTNQNTVDPERELTTLAIELNFIHSYFHLLKTRYGAGIDLHVDVQKVDQERYLPPLTLQMLVENAVKHNVIHASMPLFIEIKSTPAGHLLVRNNRQPKTMRAERRAELSTKVGLSNIRAKYRLLNGRYGSVSENAVDIDITETNTHFAVCLPLLNDLSR